MSKKILKLKKFWNNKKILLTGHTGFKGSWLVVFLNLLGAKVYGYSLKPKKLSLYKILGLDKVITDSHIGDIRDYNKLKKYIKKTSPDFVIHMAAQPLVRYSYDFPKYTYEVNAIGTLNILDNLKKFKSIKCALIITTDKVYKIPNKKKYFKENDELGGHDPYSSSKACAELICESYKNILLSKKKTTCVTVRAGNVIGGGDFALNRIIPDFYRAIKSKKKLTLRYPDAVRPWQHVIEPLFGYLLLIMHLYKKNFLISGAWNFGPGKNNNVKVNKIVSLLNNNLSKKIKIIEKYNSKNKYKETSFLSLNSEKAKKTLNWSPKYNIYQTIKLVSRWHDEYKNNKKNILNFTKKQIQDYIN